MTRYDELANEAEIGRARSEDRLLKRGFQGATAAVGGVSGLPSKIAPFLSEYIPTDLAFKGINRVAPALGKILQRGAESGLSIKDGLDYIKSNMPAPEEKKEEEKNIIKKYSPELDKFIQQGVAAGKDIGEIAHAARKKDMKTADKISKDTKKVWLDLVEEIYGMPGKNKKQEKISPENAQNGQNTAQNTPNNGQMPMQGATDWAAKAKMFRDFIDNA